jgi:hypothetical protein
MKRSRQRTTKTFPTTIEGLIKLAKRIPANTWAVGTRNLPVDGKVFRCALGHFDICFNGFSDNINGFSDNSLREMGVSPDRLAEANNGGHHMCKPDPKAKQRTLDYLQSLLG